MLRGRLGLMPTRSLSQKESGPRKEQVANLFYRRATTPWHYVVLDIIIMQVGAKEGSEDAALPLV